MRYLPKTEIELLVATHDTMAVDSADRVLQIHDGGIIVY
jgi:ABC-type lipoprotein export system ATPase subunit